MSEPNVAVLVRTRNEERCIERFIRSYPSFPILVADGGSTDATLDICARYPNVCVRPFEEMVERGGVSRNPEGKHVNFLIKWAIEAGYEWVIFDDCDCAPNYLLREAAPSLFSNPADAIFAVRIYLYQGQGHLLRMSQPDPKRKDYEGSLWAWRLASGLRASQDDPFMLTFPLRDMNWQVHQVRPPMCLLHDPWPDHATIERKHAFYQALWEPKPVARPIDFGGPLVPLPEWAHE